MRSNTQAARRGAMTWALWVAVAALASGCAAILEPELDAAHPFTQAFQAAKEVERARDRNRQRAAQQSDPASQTISNGLKKIFGSQDDKIEPSPLPRPQVTVESDYRKFRQGIRDGTKDLWDEGLRTVCSSMGGNFVEGSFCVSKTNPDEVRFFVRRDWYYVEWFEPTSSPHAPAYWALVRSAGFVTQAEREYRTRAAANRRQQEAFAEELRLQSAWPLMREVGARVCKAEGGVNYMGFVEDFTETRMRVLVSQANIGNSGYRPGGFQPHVIWTTPHGWSRC